MYRSKLHIEVSEPNDEIDSSAAVTPAAAATATTITTTPIANKTIALVKTSMAATATSAKQTATATATKAIATATATATTTTKTTTTTTTETTDAKLKSLSLRGNQLCGSILIGNYSHLTYLEVTENEMEILDLSTLGQLITLKCSNNKLMELMINGRNLNTIMASNNCLHTLTVSPVPMKLKHLNITHNNFTVLPSWVASVVGLQTLDAQHNQLQTLMEFCTNYRIELLQRLDLSYNALRTLPKRLPAGWASLRALHLHANELQQLPENLFAVTSTQLSTLNVSCNRLSALPPPPSAVAPAAGTTSQLSSSASSAPRKKSTGNQFWHLEIVLATSNQLDERIFDVLATCSRLRVLHVAYNKITTLSVRHVRNWCALEELVLAGNLLQRLPENLATLQHLQVLRVHSNLLLSLPTNLSKLKELRVLDVAHNHISHVNLQHLLAKSLKYLDLSCNLQLQVDEQQLKECQAEKHWSFVDVTGKNRDCLPTAKSLNNEKTTADHCIGSKSATSTTSSAPWSVGFSETPGKCRRLQVAQVHSCNYHVDESCLYGMLDCAGAEASNGATTNVTTKTANSLAPLCKWLPRVLQQEQQRAQQQQRSSKDGSGEMALRQTLLAAQQKLGETTDANMAAGGILLCHIAKETSGQSNGHRSFVKSHKSKRYTLRVASVGNASVYLVRKTSNVRLTPPARNTLPPIEQQSAINSSGQTSAAMAMGVAAAAAAAVVVTETPLSNEDEYLVLCNAELWLALDIDRVAREIRKEENVVLAAKRLQNIAQSFGANGNLSVLVVRLRNIGTDVDQMIRELKQIVRKKPHPISGMVTARINNVQRLYERQGGAAVSIGGSGFGLSVGAGGGNGGGTILSRIQQQQQQQQQSSNIIMRSERTSPSGQSDKAQGQALQRNGAGGGIDDGEECELELLEETDSVLSEEQFKCWEYMLEQNTQLLFDKELNTISKSFSSSKQHQAAPTSPILSPTSTPAHTAGEQLEYKSNLLKSINNKFISTSSPHLLLQSTNSSSNSSSNNTTPEEPLPYSHHQHQHQHQHQHYQQQPTAAPHSKQQLSFLSKYFGSCRSFQATPAMAGGYSLAEARQRRDSLTLSQPLVVSSSKHANVMGGPHAAYFGSLQRLMPYNLEYDFAVMQERAPIYDEEERDFSVDGMEDNERDDLIGGGDGGVCDEDDDDENDFMQHDCRMRKYWGVATTEL